MIEVQSINYTFSCRKKQKHLKYNHQLKYERKDLHSYNN